MAWAAELFSDETARRIDVASSPHKTPNQMSYNAVPPPASGSSGGAGAPKVDFAAGASAMPRPVSES